MCPMINRMFFLYHIPNLRYNPLQKYCSFKKNVAYGVFLFFIASKYFKLGIIWLKNKRRALESEKEDVFFEKIVMTAKPPVAERALRRPMMSKEISVTVATATPRTIGRRER